MKDCEEFRDDKKEKPKPVIVRNTTDLQRLKLEKLMKNPDKEVIIPDRPRERGMPNVPDFVRNVMGSSAGAGSGEFHVYRHLRRKEYARQKFMKERGEHEKMEDDYHDKLEENKKKAEEETAKKRAKRLKKKQKMKNKAKKPKVVKSESEESEKSEESNDDQECKNEKILVNEETGEIDNNEKDRSDINSEENHTKPTEGSCDNNIGVKTDEGENNIKVKS